MQETPLLFVTAMMIKCHDVKFDFKRYQYEGVNQSKGASIVIFLWGFSKFT